MAQQLHLSWGFQRLEGKFSRRINLQTSIKSLSVKRHWHVMKPLLQKETPFPWLSWKGADVTGHLPKELQMVAGHSTLSPTSLPSGITSAATLLPAGKLGQHRLQPLGVSHMALISNPAQATATRPGRQLQDLSNAASYNAAFCWEHGLVLITKPSLFFLLLQLQGLESVLCFQLRLSSHFNAACAMACV